MGFLWDCLLYLIWHIVMQWKYFTLNMIHQIFLKQFYLQRLPLHNKAPCPPVPCPLAPCPLSPCPFAPWPLARCLPVLFYRLPVLLHPVSVSNNNNWWLEYMLDG
jgi:hypothetical protein